MIAATRPKATPGGRTGRCGAAMSLGVLMGRQTPSIFPNSWNFRRTLYHARHVGDVELPREDPPPAGLGARPRDDHADARRPRSPRDRPHAGRRPPAGLQRALERAGHPAVDRFVPPPAPARGGHHAHAATGHAAPHLAAARRSQRALPGAARRADPALAGAPRPRRAHNARRPGANAPGPRSTSQAQAPGSGAKPAYIMPPMSGMPPPTPAPSLSGISATMASVVRMFFAIEAAFCSAERVTMAGSMMPSATRSTISPFAAFRPWPFFALRTSLTTTEPSRPAFSAIWRSGSSSARRTMRAPVRSSSS